MASLCFFVVGGSGHGTGCGPRSTTRADHPHGRDGKSRTKGEGRETVAGVARRLTFAGELAVVFAAALVPADDALDVGRFVGLRAAGLRAVGLASGGGAGRQGVPGRENRSGGHEAGNVLRRGGGRQVSRGHWGRWSDLYGAWARGGRGSGCGTGRGGGSGGGCTGRGQAGPGVPRGPRGRRGYQRHRGGGAARREPHLQRGGELGVVVSS